MSAQRYLVADLSRKSSRSQNSRARWDFWTHFSIPADIHSIFYALTEPEYIEAWLRAPGLRSVSVASAGSNYFLEFRSDEASLVEVRGSWLSRHPMRIAFTWNRNDQAMHVESTVSMTLRQIAGRTLLQLHHYGFTSREQSLWHGELWNSSTLRLARLTAVVGDHSGVHICAVSPLHRKQLVNRGLGLGTDAPPRN